MRTPSRAVSKRCTCETPRHKNKTQVGEMDGDSYSIETEDRFLTTSLCARDMARKQKCGAGSAGAQVKNLIQQSRESTARGRARIYPGLLLSFNAQVGNELVRVQTNAPLLSPLFAHNNNVVRFRVGWWGFRIERSSVKLKAFERSVLPHSQRLHLHGSGGASGGA
jgi:hypothetical protein